MDKNKKINILYKKAMGQPINITVQESRELSKYKVSAIGKPLTTKNNISQYISAVDRGYHKNFYDWCLDNNKGDARTKNGNSKALKSFNNNQNICIMAMGWITWGVAIYWFAGGDASVKNCSIIGAIVSLILFRLKREAAFFTCFFLPLLIAAFFYTKLFS